jgi:hypothetical protein
MFQSLDSNDRRMLLVLAGSVLALFVLLAVFTPAEDPGQNPVPDSYLTGTHGARAAYTLLQRSGYKIDRWEHPLSLLASNADADTVLILAEPHSYQQEDRWAIQTVLQKGGRVIATGFEGGTLLPGSAVEPPSGISFSVCEAKPEGFGSLVGTGPIWILPRAGWKLSNPAVRVAYTCADQPVVVEYPFLKGTVIWWANSTPLENGSITRGQNLELLLNSIGPASGHHVYWDESLHWQSHTAWDYTSGSTLPLLASGSVGLALLVILSFSRRRGPIRPLPSVPRATPIEFLDALGSLYRAAGAANTAAQVAWDRFRSQAASLCGQPNPRLAAAELAEVLQSRFGSVGEDMQSDLMTAEQACWNESLKPKEALTIVRKLRSHEHTLRSASSTRRAT